MRLKVSMEIVIQATEKPTTLTDLAGKKVLHQHSTLPETAFGSPRDFLDNRFVYVVVSPRARGLSIGVNMNPDKQCDFDCLYCEVNRMVPARESRLDIEAMAMELKKTISFVRAGRLRACFVRTRSS